MTTAQQLAAQAKRARDATIQRDSLILQMRTEGASLRVIAEAAGLTHPAIVKIIRKAPVTAL